MIVTADEVLALCGRKFVARRQEGLNKLLIRAFSVEPRHLHYRNAVSINARQLRKKFGEAGGRRIITRYFKKVGNKLEGRWSSAYRLRPEIAKRVERHLWSVDALSRKPFTATLKEVGDTGLSFPDSLNVSLDHLQRVLDTVQAAIEERGPDCYFASHLGSSQTLQTVYQQLLAVRLTVIETGGLPATYTAAENGRYTGDHEHHPLRLTRPTRYFTLGARQDLWDVDLSNAHLAIAQGLLETWYPESQFPRLRMYLLHRSEWIGELLRRLKDDEIVQQDAKACATAWLFGSRRCNPGSSNAVIRHPRFPAVLGKLKVWSDLYDELQQAAKLLAARSPLTKGKQGRKLSYLLSEWETRIMAALGRKIADAGLSLQAWLFDGFLLLQDHSNPTGKLAGLIEQVATELEEQGYEFPTLGLKVKSVSSLFLEHVDCLKGEKTGIYGQVAV